MGAAGFGIATPEQVRAVHAEADLAGMHPNLSKLRDVVEALAPRLRDLIREKQLQVIGVDIDSDYLAHVRIPPPRILL